MLYLVCLICKKVKYKKSYRGFTRDYVPDYLPIFSSNSWEAAILLKFRKEWVQWNADKVNMSKTKTRIFPQQ